MSESVRIALGVLFAALSVVAAGIFNREHDRDGFRRSALVWAGLALVLASLSFFTITDLGPLLMDDVRQEARSEGWYMSRRPMQARVILGILVAAILGYGTLLVRLGDNRRNYLLPVTASAYLLALNAIRLVSLHQVDAVMGKRVGWLTFGAVLQVVGLTLTGVALLQGMRRLNPNRASTP